MIWLHPAMTADQIADWCEKNRMVVTIEYTYDAEGKVTPLISAREDHLDPSVPLYLRADRFQDQPLPSLLLRQAE